MAKSKIIKKGITVSVFAILLLVLVAVFLSEYGIRENKTKEIEQKFSVTLEHKRTLAIKGISRLMDSVETYGGKDKGTLFPDNAFQKQTERGISFFLYEEDRMVFWTDQSIPIPDYYVYNYFTNHVIRTGNGYFHPVVERQGIRKYLALIKLKDDYAVSNRYLENNFWADFGIPSSAKIVAKEDANLLLSDSDGNLYFSLYVPDALPKTTEVVLSVLLAFIIAAIFFVFYFALGLIKGKWQVTIYVLASVSVTAYFIFSENTFYFFGNYGLPMFGPELYAGTLFSSLGMLAVFSVWLLYASYSISYLLSRFFVIKNRRSSWVILLILPVVASGTVYFIMLLVEDLIFNSLVFPNIDRLPETSFYALVVALSLLVVFHSLRIFLRIVGSAYYSEYLRKNAWYILLVIPLAVAASFFTQGKTLFIIPAVILVYASFTSWSNNDLFRLLLSCGAGAMILTVATVWPMAEKKDIEAQMLASKMTLENDPISEYLYSSLKSRLDEDEIFRRGIFSSQRLTSDFMELFIKKYFSGYWLKYGITAGVFDSKTRTKLNMSSSGINDYEYYNEIIETIARPTPVGGFYFVRKPSGRVSYIARLDYEDTLRYGNPRRTVFLEFNSRVINETAGLPDLLLDNSMQTVQSMEGYSYARYTNNRLVNEVGEFPYYTDLRTLISLPFFEKKYLDGAHWHYVHNNPNTNKNDTIVVTYETQDISDFLNRFSWWFMCIMVGIGLGRLVLMGKGVFSYWRKAGFKTKIQIVTMVIVSIFFVVMVRGTVYYLVKQHNEKNRRAILEKLHSVAFDIEETMGGKLSRLKDQKGFLEYRLSELGNLFGTDINIYDIRGFLISGSRPELFSSGFISNRLNPQAFDYLKNEKRTEVVRNESIGKLEYISAYTPLIDEDGETVAYLNIPYFLKQKEINAELSESVNSLVNIFIGAITLLLVIMLLVTNRITDPIRQLGSRLRELRYGNKTVKIKYDAEDEIGYLVKEYNRLTDELEHSAELLAEKERDSAWREMARQVAHEIKNPLTPMKLNVEFLERAWKDGSPDFQDRLSKFKNVMVEQIDTLAHIADEFSNFAKLPQPQNELTDLAEILSGVAMLYSNNEQQVQVIFEDNGNPMPIWADKEHILRVFNNLVKNAIQAIPDNRQGKVEIFAFTDNHTFTVLVKDNGTGIPEDLRERIFIPNFTTKSTGSGLGLAICRSILRAAGGEIGFITKTGEGTTFRVGLPVYKDEKL